MKWTVRILQGIMAAGFFMAGMMKFFAGTEVIERLYTEPLGYSVEFMYLIGSIELLSTACLIIGYWYARFTALGSFALSVVMTGAAISVLISGQGVVAAISPFAWVVVGLIILYGTRNSWLSSFRKKHTTYSS